MPLLLDTHALLWASLEPARLPADARAALEAPENGVFFSAASIRDADCRCSCDAGAMSDEE